MVSHSLWSAKCIYRNVKVPILGALLISLRVIFTCLSCVLQILCVYSYFSCLSSLVKAKYATFYLPNQHLLQINTSLELRKYIVNLISSNAHWAIKGKTLNGEFTLSRKVQFSAKIASVLKKAISLDITSYDSCNNRRFRGTYRFYHQGDKNRRARSNVSSNLSTQLASVASYYYRPQFTDTCHLDDECDNLFRNVGSYKNHAA
jgi:hypothetical protein